MKRLCLIAFFLVPALAHAETITYNIKQMGVNLGTATLTFGGEGVIDGQSLGLVVFKADGFNFYDEEKIYLTKDTYRPVVIERDLNIFGKKEKITERYLAGEEKIKVTKLVNGKTTEIVIDKKGDVDNIYGFIYRYRTQGSFKMGDELDIRLPTKDLKIKLTRQLKFTAMGKSWDSFYVESVPSQYKVWFDAGPKKLPLRISGSVGAVGSVMTMTDYKE